MGRHHAVEGRSVVVERPQQPPTSHRKPDELDGKQIILAPANATRAVVANSQSIVISVRFAAAVERIYNAGRIAHMPGRSVGRAIQLVSSKLQEHSELPSWDAVDVRVVLRYLAEKHKIQLPEALTSS